MSSDDRTKDLGSNQLPGLVESKPYISMTGLVYDARSNERMEGGDLTVLMETDSGYSKQWSLIPNEKGAFSIDSIVYPGMGSFYAYYADKRGKV